MNVTFEYGTDTECLPRAILYLLSLPVREVPPPPLALPVEAVKPTSEADILNKPRKTRKPKKSKADHMQRGMDDSTTE